MLNYFPKYFTSRAVVLYLATLLIVSVWFLEFHMDFIWFVWGILEVLFFFIGSRFIISNFTRLSQTSFKKKLFWTTFFISLTYVIFTYFLYINLRGEPFEYDPTDGLGYHEESAWFVEMFKAHTLSIFWSVFYNIHDLSDTGYLYYLNLVYLITDSNIFITRVLKCLYHAWLCVLIYKIASRNFGEGIGRMAAVFCMLMPQIIFYNCSHRKEMEMILLSTLCIERIDFLLHSKQYNFWKITIVILLIGSLFTFRTVLGIAAGFAFASALLLSPSNILSKQKKWFIGGWALLTAIVLLGGPILNEVSNLWQQKTGDSYQGKTMEWRASEANAGSDGRVNKFAKYAGASIFAPIIVVFPFTTMVKIADQENQQRLNGGYFIKNFMAFFVLLSIYKDIKRKKWKEHILLYGFTFSYLGMLAMSEFAQSERFHLPALPFLLMFAAYGIATIENKNKRLIPWFMIFLFIVNIVWNWFKLAGRGY